MWSVDLKPVCFLHVSRSHNIARYYVIDVHFSSFIVERHVFSNFRSYNSFLNHFRKVMCHYHSLCSSLSYEYYRIFAEELTDEFTFNN